MSSKKEPKELALLKEWKDTLNLNDWYILLQTDCKRKDLTLDYADGEVEYEEVSKSAVIRILKKSECDGFREFDLEEILVHELLHLKFSLLAEGDDWAKDLQLRVLHQIIDETARALVKVKRKGEKS